MEKEDITLRILADEVNFFRDNNEAMPFESYLFNSACMHWVNEDPTVDSVELIVKLVIAN